MKIIRDEFDCGGYEMTSAVGAQMDVTLWDYVIDKTGEYWFWPSVHQEAGSMVHVGWTVQAGRRKSEGYGGRIMQFPTKDGIIEIQGPWHTNTTALFERTGVDLRDKHLTFVVVALERENKGYRQVLKDVLYIDEAPGIVGTFNRGDGIAQKIADEIDRVVYRYSKSSGGSSCGPVEPSSWSKEKKAAYWKEKSAIAAAKRPA